MPEFEVHGYGRESGQKRKRRYWATDEEEAIHKAGDDGTIVERVELVPDLPATEAQKAYARRLGIAFDECTGKWEMSGLIDQELKREPLEKARVYGLDVSDLWDAEQIWDVVHDYERARMWVYSALRHAAKGWWARYGDVPVDHVWVYQKARELMKHPKLMKYIHEADEGMPDAAYYKEIDRLGIASGDEWFFFGTKNGGPSTISKAYGFVVYKQE